MKLPDAALQQNIAVLGKNGSGKTYAAKAAIVEPLLEAGARVAIVDPTGAWWGLRSSRDGKGAGFKVLVLGGDHCDLPLPPNGGAAIARLIVDQGVNLVADCSQMTVGERTRWFTEFAGTLYRANKAPLHLVLDEAHNFAPQGKVPDPEAGKMLHAASTLASQGRSRGIRLTMITQRPQKLHKDSLTSAETLIAMRVIAPHDRRAVQDWIDGCAGEEGDDVIDTLAELAKGEGWVWYPEGRLLQRTKFPAIKTFDSSATPMGAPLAAPKGAAEIDLTEIRAALADAVRQAAENDPKALRARISELERQLKAGSGHSTADLNAEYTRGREEGFEAARAGEAERLAQIAPEVFDLATKVTIAGMRQALDALEIVTPPLNEMVPRAKVTASTRELLDRHAHSRTSPSPRLQKPAVVPARTLQEPRIVNQGGNTQQRVLNALAELDALGVEKPERVQVAFLAGYKHPRSKGFINTLGAMRSAGLIAYVDPGRLMLTAAGAAQADASGAPRNSRELQERVFDLLGGVHERILRPLIGEYPKPMERATVANIIGYEHPRSKGFINGLGRLRSLGFIEYQHGGLVAATPILFVHG